MSAWKRRVIIAACCSMLSVDAYANEPSPASTGAAPDSLFVTKLPGQNGSQQDLQLSKYDPTFYELAYQLFLQNNDIQDAYAIAFSAVQQQPKNLEWRKRLITVSIWNMQPTVTLDQYLYFAQNQHDNESFTKGIELARKVHEDGLLSQFIALDIKNGHNQESIWKEYIDVLTRIGELQKAIDQLIAYRHTLAPQFYYTQLVELYGYLSEINHQQQILKQYNAALGITPFSAVKQSTINLTTGNVNKAYKQLHTASPQAKNDNFYFWELYGQMSWLHNSDQSAIQAYKKLLFQVKPKPNLDVFNNLVNLYEHNQLLIAYYYVNLGRKIHPYNQGLAQNTFILAGQLGRWDNITRLLLTVPPSLRRKLNKDPEFLVLITQYLRQRSTVEKTAQFFQQAIRRFPEHDDLKAGFINFLIENNRVNIAILLLAQPPKNICLSPELWQAYAVGYTYTHNYAMTHAITQLYKHQFPNYKRDPYWLIGFKEFLEQSLQIKQARAVSLYTWPIYLNLLHNQKKPPDIEQYFNYLTLSLNEAPGDPTAQVFVKLQKNLTPDVAELMLDWALEQRNYALADAIYAYFIRVGWKSAPPSVLMLSLYHRDGYLMRDMIVQHAPILAGQERVEAAGAIGAIRLTQSMAYENMQIQPHESGIYDNAFTPIMLKAADKIDFRQQYYQYGSEEGPRTQLDFTTALTPSISITPYAYAWFLKNVSATELATVPPHDEQAGLKARIIQAHGDLLMNVSYRDNLDSFVTAQLQKYYAITHNLTALFIAGYNQPADDTSALLIGGMKQELVGSLSYDLTATDTIQGEYDQNFFYTQNNQHLANGQQQTITYTHKFWQSYPDWTIGGYGTAAQYYDITNTITGSAASLVPAGDIANGNFFIPANYIEYGASIGFGQNYHMDFNDYHQSYAYHFEDYSHTWRPFGQFTILNSTTSGFGWVGDAGIGGSVFGGDRLAFYYEEGSNQGVGVNKTRLIEAMYQFYF